MTAFAKQMMDTAQVLERETHFKSPLRGPRVPIRTAEDAAMYLVLEVGCSLPSAVKLHLGQATKEETAFPVFFVFLLVSQIAALLAQEECPFDGDQVLGQVVRGLLQGYGEDTKIAALERGRSMALDILKTQDFEEWGQGVQVALIAFVETGEPTWRDTLCKLYVALDDATRLAPG